VRTVGLRLFVELLFEGQLLVEGTPVVGEVPRTQPSAFLVKHQDRLHAVQSLGTHNQSAQAK
jgi:hypothetical protein